MQAYFGRVKALVHVRIVVAATFDFMTEEDWVVARTKEGNGGGEGRKKSLLSPRPSPSPSLFFASKNVRAPEENACTAG